MLGDPHLVVAELLGQFEEAQIVVKAFDHFRQIRKLAQTEDPEPCSAHVVLAAIAAGMVMSAAGRVKRDFIGAAWRRPPWSVVWLAPAEEVTPCSRSR